MCKGSVTQVNGRYWANSYGILSGYGISVICGDADLKYVYSLRIYKALCELESVTERKSFRVYRPN